MKFKTGAIKIIAAVMDNQALPKHSKTVDHQLKRIKNILAELDQRITAMEVACAPEPYEKPHQFADKTQQPKPVRQVGNVIYLNRPSLPDNTQKKIG